MFTTMQTITLGEHHVRRAKCFKRWMRDTGELNYSDSNQGNIETVLMNHYHSKLGEAAAQIAIEASGRTCSFPDYAIYHPEDRNWGPDLTSQGTPIGVKSVTREAARRIGAVSWVFQKGKWRRDTILDVPEHWVVFTLIETDHVVKVLPPYQMKELTLKAPILDKYKTEKAVVYAKDLPKRRMR